MTTNCKKFYLVQSGDSCYDIAAANGFSLDNFYSWNPAVGDTCASLFPSYYVCVGLIGSKTAAPTSTVPTNGVTTPTPTQSGMVRNCKKFYDVKSGDGCAAIASSYGISLSDFYSWNPAVKTDCSQLWPDYYVCVGLIGGSVQTSTKKPVSTTKKPTATNGITTPTPTQTGMVGNCDAFYLVKSGDGCAAIATKKGITLAQFYKWNPAVGSDCSKLYPDYYVCVSIVGVSPSTTVKRTTSTKGNGITTPTPIQTGMVSNCKKFYDVKSGDICSTIVKKFDITLKNFYAWNPAVKSDCSALWPDYYVCVGLA
jgi:LysM repeat protein